MNDDLYITALDKANAMRATTVALILRHLKNGDSLDSWKNNFNICLDVCKNASEEVQREYQNYLKSVRNEKRKLRKLAKIKKSIVSIITEAYNSCNYRKCKKEHKLEIILDYGKICRDFSGVGSRAIQHRTNNRPRTVRSHHTIYVRSNYLKTMMSLGFYTFNNCLIIDAKPKGFSQKGFPVFELTLVRKSDGFHIIHDKKTCITFRPLAAGGATEIEEYYGKTIKRKELCQILGIGTDTPDCAIVDKFEDSEIALKIN